MINVNDLPATMPSSMKEQLVALAPYMTDFCEKRGGGFVIDMKIPIESFIMFNINHEALAEHNMTISVEVEAPEPAVDGRIMRQARYADARLTYL